MRSQTKFMPKSGERGSDRELNSFVQSLRRQPARRESAPWTFRSSASLPAEDPRIKGTLRAIEKRLLIDDEFVLRYELDNSSDGLPPGEGGFPGLQLLAGGRITFCRAAIKMLKDCLSGCSPAATTWGCWRKSSIRRAGACLAIFPRPTATSA